MALYVHNFFSHLQFLDRVTPDIDFTDKVIVQCDVPIAKILFKVTVIRNDQNEF